MTIIPVLTQEDLQAIEATVEIPGQLAKSWMALTRLVRERLPGLASGKAAALDSLYRNETHYLALAIGSDGELKLDFGTLDANLRQFPVGRLSARWDELGVTGPYRVLVRDREYSLNVFCAVLERYLDLPRA